MCYAAPIVERFIALKIAAAQLLFNSCLADQNRRLCNIEGCNSRVRAKPLIVFWLLDQRTSSERTEEGVREKNFPFYYKNELHQNRPNLKAKHLISFDFRYRFSSAKNCGSSQTVRVIR